jgi:NAD(P)-dependent dehydrogenase (short-subunit alcohol dehydrogenase family)
MRRGRVSTANITTLTGKTALITGAQQGIGAAIARAFAAQGANVVINWLDDEAGAKSVATDARAAGVQAVTVQGSVAEPAAIEDMLCAADGLGGADILVNNAAIFPRVDFFEMTGDDWDTLMGINLRGTFLCSQAAAKRMVAKGSGGAIINLSSGAAFRGSPRGVHYVTGKAGVLGFTKAISQELAQYNIRANAIAPGLTDTAQPRYGMTEQEIADTFARNPLQGVIEASDIADAAVFLASDAASKITGQTLHVNGGSYLW